MRIFAAVRHSFDPSKYYGGLWSGNFYPALRQLGHEIVESGVDLLPASRFMHIAGDFNRDELAVRSEITQRIVDEIVAAHRKQPIDLFFSYFYNAHFDPSGFDELRRQGIPSLNFYCNSIYQFEYVSAIAAKADYSWHPEKEARDSYRAIGARPIWVQMGADPDIYHPIENVTGENRACFVGQKYADRDRWMAALIAASVPVDIYGPGWVSLEENRSEPNPVSTEYLGRRQHVPGTKASYFAAFGQTMYQEGIVRGCLRVMRQIRYRAGTRRLAPHFVSFAKGPIPFQKIAEIFAAHSICLNFSNVWADGRPGSRLIPHVRLRDFEAPMCRTCYLTGYTNEIAEFYELGKEIDTYNSPAELVEKTKFYLSNPGAAEKLRQGGYERARRDHTWVHRFQELFRKIGLQSTTAR